MIKRLVIATHNSKKAVEMTTLMRQHLPTCEIVTLEAYPNSAEPEETGKDYWENAAIKAVSARDTTHEWCIADDAGLEIDALDGAPGLYSKRFAGENTPFDEKMRIILDELSRVPESQRTARFRCCVAIAAPGGIELPKWDLAREVDGCLVFNSTCEGMIALDRAGAAGFGYDPIFFYPPLGKTFAELTAEEKHAVSHRGQVLKLVGEYLQSLSSE